MKTGVAIRILDEGISTKGKKGKMVVTILSALVKAGRERILERTIEKRLEARAKGVRFGRNPIINSGHVLTLHGEDLGATEIVKRMKIGSPTVYKILHEDIRRENKNMPFNYDFPLTVIQKLWVLVASAISYKL